ncbi:MAG: amidohydrolase family protein [Cyclobacteriaceae bacterium]|nr:amidohydrolase family protein [Cyclobacteriaceae bacterium]
MKSILSRRRTLLLLWAFTFPILLVAQDEKMMAPVSRTYVITNVNIIQSPGRKIDIGTVVIKNGLILAVGKKISIPSDAIVIKADSMYLYAGFIDGLSHAGIVKSKEEMNRDRPKDPGNPPPDKAGITPQNSVLEFLNPVDKSLEDLRSVGFTAAHVVPYGGMLPGRGSVILLGGSSANEMLLQPSLTFYSELTPAERVYPATVMGVMAKYRDLYRQASLTKSYETVYASNRAGLERPATDRILESFYPVIDKRMPVFFRAERVLDIQRVISLQKDLGFTLMLGDLKEGWDVINQIKTTNAKVFLSLDLPEEKKEEKKEDKTEKKEEKPKSISDLEKEALEKRKVEFTAKYTAQAGAFQKAGLKFGFSTISAKPKDIPANLRRMIAAGLSEDVALASLTTLPAEVFGLTDRLGTVDNGKIANLVISDKPYFHEKATIRYVFVDGHLFKMEVKEIKKVDPNAKPEIAGNWTLTTETPQGKSDSNLTIKKEGSGYSGKISGGRLPEPSDLQRVELTGNSLKFVYAVSMGGQAMTVTVEATVEGDTLKGTASVGQFGSFPLEGKRDPKF